jgi:hypothetical protein
VRLAGREEEITCKRCMKALIASRERVLVGKRLSVEVAE